MPPSNFLAPSDSGTDQGDAMFLDKDPYYDTSDSEAEEEEILLKHFMVTGGLQEKLKRTLAQKNHKLGIKRHPGHYMLKDHCHYKTDEPGSHYYSGRHWEVDSNAAKMHRATEQLTKEAIARAVENEREWRLQNEVFLQAMANKALMKMQQEFSDAIKRGEEHDEEIKEKQCADAEVNMDNARNELLLKVHNKDLHRQMEEERERQINILEVMSTENDGLKKSASTEDLLHDLSVANKRKSLVQDDLMEAMGLLEEDEEDLEQEEQAFAMEMKDLAMLEMHRNIINIRLKVATEYERKKQCSRSRAMKTFSDEVAVKTLEKQSNLRAELIRDFTWISQAEYEQDIQEHNITENKKELVLQQITRVTHTKIIEQECAHERTLRIHQMEIELLVPDPVKEFIKDYMQQVQEEMILERFHGRPCKTRRIEAVPSLEFNDYGTEEDQKKRAMRLKARHKCSVTAFF